MDFIFDNLELVIFLVFIVIVTIKNALQMSSGQNRESKGFDKLQAITEEIKRRKAMEDAQQQKTHHRVYNPSPSPWNNQNRQPVREQQPSGINPQDILESITYNEEQGRRDTSPPDMIKPLQLHSGASRTGNSSRLRRDMLARPRDFFIFRELIDKPAGLRDR